MDKIRFMAFYTSTPFWAKDPVDLTKTLYFKGRMSEHVIDVNNNIFSVKISRDGQIEIRINKLEVEITNLIHSKGIDNITFQETAEYWSTYLNYLNTFYLLLDCQIIKLQGKNLFILEELTSRDAFRIRYNTDGSGSNSDCPMNKISTIYSKIRWLGAKELTPLSMHHSEMLSNREIVTEETLLSTIDLFKKACHNHELIKDLSSFTKSVSELKNANYELSIILSWFVIEKNINTLWSNHINSFNYDITQHKKRISRKRKTNALDRKMMSIRDKIEFLELMNKIPFELYEDLSQTNTKRNRIVHQDNSDQSKISYKDSIISLQSLQKLLEIRYEFHFTPNLIGSLNHIT